MTRLRRTSVTQRQNVPNQARLRRRWTTIASNHVSGWFPFFLKPLVRFFLGFRLNPMKKKPSSSLFWRPILIFPLLRSLLRSGQLGGRGGCWHRTLIIVHTPQSRIGTNILYWYGTLHKSSWIEHTPVHCNIKNLNHQIWRSQGGRGFDKFWNFRSELILCVFAPEARRSHAIFVSNPPIPVDIGA